MSITIDKAQIVYYNGNLSFKKRLIFRKVYSLFYVWGGFDIFG